MIICEGIKFTELIISYKIEKIKDYWFHTNKPYNHQDAIELGAFTAYRSTFKLGKYVKRLHFKGSYSEFDQVDLNDMIQLEQLKIELKASDADTLKIVEINLPNLKVLEIDDFQYDVYQCKFYCTTPKLEILKCFDFESIHLADPNTINHLESIFFFQQ